MSAVIFDVGGVLLVPNLGLVDPALRLAGVEVDGARLEAAHYRAVHHVDAETTALDGRAYGTGYLNSLGLSGRELDAARKAMEALAERPALELWSTQVPGGPDVLRRLCSSGVGVAIVSNADGTVEESLQRQGICQVGAGQGAAVAAVIDSSVVGVAKPDPRIFEPALRALETEPSDTWYVGDSERLDVRSALAAGIRPIHFDPYGLCRNPLSHPHLRVLSNIWEVVDFEVA